jgi:HPr kinase/phosphorylase
MARIKAEHFIRAVGLETLYGAGAAELEVATPDLNRPGLALAGFCDYFPAESVQVVGRQEMTYLAKALDDAQRYEAMDRLLALPFPCLVISRSLEPPQGLLQLAVKHVRPVYRSALSTHELMAALTDYLNLVLAPRATVHGVLVDVYGIGLLITGESGMGKSETALELLRRGHRLVADDLVEVRRLGANQLIGSAPENIRHLMEIRGIGVINIRQMYGIGSVVAQKSIDMVAHLEEWDATKEYNRIGFEELTEEILEVKLPKLAVPVLPGRNLAIFMEVAARNQRLKSMGFDSAQEVQRLIDTQVGGVEEM